MKAPKTIKQFDSTAFCEPQEMLSGLFNAFPLGIAILDKELRYRAVNRALAAMNRVAPQAHFGKTVNDVIGEPAAMLEGPFKHVLFSGQHVSLEFSAKLLKRNETSHWIVNYFPIEGAEGRVKLVGAVVVESTRQNKVQRLFRSVVDELIRNLFLTTHDSDALLRQIIAPSHRQVPDSRTNRDRSAVMGFSDQKPFFSRQAMKEALYGCSGIDAKASACAAALTPRERDVIKLLVEGTGNKETAAMLGITVKTVEAHRARIMLKLGIHSTRELVQYAIHNKILDLVH